MPTDEERDQMQFNMQRNLADRAAEGAERRRKEEEERQRKELESQQEGTDDE
jgi:hypothetical protein